MSTFPNLSTKAGPDGGIDGQWDLAAEANVIDSPFTKKGWNIYQFKSVDIGIGRDKALRELCDRVNGAIAELINRLELAAKPALYVLFTNLELGIDRPTRTKRNSRQNDKFERLRASILANAPTNIQVEIFDAGKIEAAVRKHRVLQQTWFAEHSSSAWDEAYKREVNQWKLDAPFKGRASEVKQLGAWLIDPVVRVIALTGVSSIGKTRLALECTRPFSGVTFFADNTSALLSEGVATWASGGTGPIILGVEDPTSADAERLARQALGNDASTKLLMTIPSQKEIPATVFGDASRVQVLHVGPLDNAAAQQLLDQLNPNLDHRARDWVLEQADGNPGIIIEAATLGSELRRSVGGLRNRVTQSLRQRLEQRFGAESVLAATALSILSGVRVDHPSEIQLLLSLIAPNLSEPAFRIRIAELEGFGCIRRRGKTVAIVPPIFAAGLSNDLITAVADMPVRLFAKLDNDGQRRLLDRLVALDLPAAVWDQILELTTNEDASPLNSRLETLASLARAMPRVVASFLDRELPNLLRNIDSSEHRRDPGTLTTIIDELVEDPETASDGFDLLTRLAIHDATHVTPTSSANRFQECFVWWYPRAITYKHRQLTIENLLSSGQVEVRLLGVSALAIATDVPRSLSGRGVVPRRLGPEPTRTLIRDRNDFLEWALNRRLEIAQSEDVPARDAALKQLENVISPLAEALPGEIAMRAIDQLLNKHFSCTLTLDPRNLLQQLKWTRGLYVRYRDEGPDEWKKSWGALVERLDSGIKKLTSGPFPNRLKLAIGPTFDHEEVEFEGRKLYTPEVRVIRLAREAVAHTEYMADAWDALVGDHTPNATDFVRELGRRDQSRVFYSELLRRADTWQWAVLHGTYLAGAQEIDPGWTEVRLAELPLHRGDSNIAALLAYQQTGLTGNNETRFRALIDRGTIRIQHVAIAFSYGRWLEQLSIQNVRAVLEYIERGENMTTRLAEVISLYLHHRKPIPIELIPVSKRVLMAAQTVNDGYGNLAYHCDQIALGIAKTDTAAAFTLLNEVLEQMNTAKPFRIYGTWNLFEGPSSREFLSFLRNSAPERFYKIVTKIDRSRHIPDFRANRRTPLLDLENHREIIARLARSDPGIAEALAESAVATQPGFWEFAVTLLDSHPNAERIHASLRSAVMDQTGFSSRHEHITDAERFVVETLQRPELSESSRRWLQSLNLAIDDRKRERAKYFDDDA